MLIGAKISRTFEAGPSGGAFSHGHTFQNFPLACAAALAVQKEIIPNNNLLQNVQEKGQALEKQLKGRLASHRYVGNIRGQGLFWGVSAEFISPVSSAF
jgi:adenosylmethionine-8-amino-7-oxononanoate aminotransferase